MTQTPEELRYTEEHEWLMRLGPTRVRIGITDYAQSQLRDVVFVQLPDTDQDAAAGESVAEVESTKSVSDIYAPPRRQRRCSERGPRPRARKTQHRPLR
ncbi:hypothetical protein ACFZB6_29610 [Streptomyces syringium]|uniref:hypothetical protein n=1 Tax=Streptomyces syringium TaxID=76729 RepID=UPI0036EDC6B9